VEVREGWLSIRSGAVGGLSIPTIAVVYIYIYIYTEMDYNVFYVSYIANKCICVAVIDYYRLSMANC